MYAKQVVGYKYCIELNFLLFYGEKISGTIPTTTVSKRNINKCVYYNNENHLIIVHNTTIIPIQR